MSDFFAQAQTFKDDPDINYTTIYNDTKYLDIFKKLKGYTITKPIDYGIKISNTCYMLHKNNITTDCPTYEAIMAVFPDTSDRRISGDFVYKDGQLQREKPKTTEHQRYYTFKNKAVLFIDPPVKTNGKIITIESQLPDYPLHGNASNNTIQLGTGRYVDERCREATLDGKNWLFLLGDTIKYMQNNCDPAFTNFNHTKYVKSILVNHDISTSNKWLHERFIEWVKENCSYSYGLCDSK